MDTASVKERKERSGSYIMQADHIPVNAEGDSVMETECGRDFWFTENIAGKVAACEAECDSEDDCVGLWNDGAFGAFLIYTSEVDHAVADRGDYYTKAKKMTIEVPEKVIA